MCILDFSIMPPPYHRGEPQLRSILLANEFFHKKLFFWGRGFFLIFFWKMSEDEIRGLQKCLKVLRICQKHRRRSSSDIFPKNFKESSKIFLWKNLQVKNYTVPFSNRINFFFCQYGFSKKQVIYTPAYVFTLFRSNS